MFVALLHLLLAMSLLYFGGYNVIITRRGGSQSYKIETQDVINCSLPLK